MDWFKNWFNSKYYHILYKNRDEQEAIFFLNKIINHIKLKKGKVLDVACGKGRHAKYLNKIGFNVVGIDLSKNSIDLAKKNENEKLKFYVHDMRNVFKENEFNLATNLFTSFGYFEDHKDEQKAINSMAKNLKKEGMLLIDFMNVKKVINSLIPSEKKIIDDINFNIKRSFNENYITKDIEIIDKEINLKFQEKVRTLTLIDFNKMLEKANLKIIDLFGDYKLSDFNALHSDRLIILAMKS